MNVRIFGGGAWVAVCLMLVSCASDRGSAAKPEKLYGAKGFDLEFKSAMTFYHTLQKPLVQSYDLDTMRKARDGFKRAHKHAVEMTGGNGEFPGPYDYYGDPLADGGASWKSEYDLTQNARDAAALTRKLHAWLAASVLYHEALRMQREGDNAGAVNGYKTAVVTFDEVALWVIVLPRGADQKNTQVRLRQKFVGVSSTLHTIGKYVFKDPVATGKHFDDNMVIDRMLIREEFFRSTLGDAMSDRSSLLSNPEYYYQQARLISLSWGKYKMENDDTEAIALLRKALDLGLQNRQRLETDPDLMPLRAEKEFESVLR